MRGVAITQRSASYVAGGIDKGPSPNDFYLEETEHIPEAIKQAINIQTKLGRHLNCYLTNLYSFWNL